jgi:hypothetical protein
MNCPECRDHFAELLYASRGEPLESNRADGLQEHLQECASCAAELRGLQQAQSWLDVLNDPHQNVASAGEPASNVVRPAAPPIELYSRLVRLRRRHDAWRYAAVAATVVAVVLGVAVWWPRPATTDVGPSLPVSGVSLPAISSAAVDWGPEFQRLAARFDEQDRLLRLLTAEMQEVEGRQGTRLLAVENQAGRLGKASDLQALRLSAMQHDVDQMREFITAGKGLAQLRAGSD